MSGDLVGENIARLRRRRGLSQRVLAGLSGLSQGYVSLLERGQRSIDKRSTIVRLAAALRVTVAELAGQPFVPADPAHERANAAVPDLRAALVALGYGDVRPAARPFRAVAAAAARLSALRRECDYAQATALAASVIPALGGYAEAGEPRALRLLTVATHDAAAIVKYLGHVDLAYMAAERTQASAARLDEPAYLALAAYARLQMLPPENRGLGRRLAARSLEMPGLTANREARQAYGMIHLASAYADALAGDEMGAASHLAEAADVARSVGARGRRGGFGGLNFGAPNVVQWRMSVAIECGRPGLAVELSDRLPPASILATSRRALFHVDRGNALAQEHRDAEAVSEYLTAEGIAPQRVRLTTAVRETVGAMLRRSPRPTRGTPLAELAVRIGVI